MFYLVVRRKHPCVCSLYTSTAYTAAIVYSIKINNNSIFIATFYHRHKKDILRVYSSVKESRITVNNRPNLGHPSSNRILQVNKYVSNYILVDKYMYVWINLSLTITEKVIVVSRSYQLNFILFTLFLSIRYYK